jgi:type I restriction enzyme S subunit
MRVSALRELCAFRHGGTPSKATPEFWSGEIPWVSPKDMKTSTVCDAVDRISQAAIENSAASVVPAGSSLLVVRSGVLAHTLPVALVTAPVAFNQDIKAVLPNSSAVLPEYVYWFLRSKAPYVVARGVKKGATVHSVQSGFIENLQVPVPTHDQQRRIVDLLSRAEGIVRLRRQAQQKAAELIPSIFIDMFGDPVGNPNKWPLQPLGNIVQSISGGTPSKARPDFWEGDLPWVSPKDMKRDEIIDAADHVSRTVLNETNLKLVPPESVLIVVRGMILVHSVPVAINRVPVTINQDMKALRPASRITANYLQWLLKVSHARLLGAVSTAGHGTKKLDTNTLMGMSFPVPPTQLQQKFEARTLAASSILTQYVEAEQKATAVFDALLFRAFH